ncbi:hypothetical protein Ddye_005669 [Dipteronia dyeriana]|uniref:Laccase n=1 Tax=Dipteronia dyeriana TaxID=168575 RepID=A0AAD9XH79_9ROSI|nr:hypothetical protein Ddye_005669 [Dipteronia dyeriana]
MCRPLGMAAGLALHAGSARCARLEAQHVTNKIVTRLCETNSILVVNDRFPGQTIHVRKGDTVFVNVYNYGDMQLTLHWHGVKQPRNPWSDGPEYVTQCPIQPGNNFTYEVIFSSEEGTVWWHAHSDWTRNTVHGPIVVHPAEGTTSPYPQPDAEEIIILETCLPQMHTQSMANLEISIIALKDASYLKPVVTSYIMIGPGQTMNVLVTANQSLGQYYMAAHQYYTTDIATFDGYDKTNVTAILQYNGDYKPPTTPYYPTSMLPPSRTTTPELASGTS